MDLFVRLREATLQAQQDCELPDAFAARLLAVAEQPHRYPQADAEIMQLLDMLPDYDTYGQTGYMGMGVSDGIIDGAIRRLEQKRVATAG